MAPVLLLLLRRDETARWFRARALPVVLVSVLASGAIVSAIASLREAGYASGSLSMSETAEILQHDTERDPRDTSGLELVVQLATERIGGIGQLVAVSSSRVRGVAALWGLLSGDPRWTDPIGLDTMGFIPRQDRTSAFGVSLGLWGSLAVSDSLLLLFVATALLTMLPLTIEILFSRVAQQSVGHVLSALMAFVLWSQPSFFVLWRFGFVAFMTLVVVFLLARPGSAGDDVVPSQKQADGTDHGVDVEPGRVT
jgi:hypothetical protein